LGPHLSSRAVIGREVPLRALGEALESAAAGRPSLALVSGEAGIGKTRLVAEIEAAADGFLVLHGECMEFGGEELAYAPIAAALRSLPADWTAAWLDELPAEARGVLAAVMPRESPGAGGPGRLHELLLDLLGRLPAPVLLTIEDIHWADQSTLALLAFLARNLRSERVAVVVTFRLEDALRRRVGELSRRPSVLHV
jgi:predicted ATPase